MKQNSSKAKSSSRESKDDGGGRMAQNQLNVVVHYREPVNEEHSVMVSYGEGQKQADDSPREKIAGVS